MKISCQNCSSKYTVSDEKVQGKTVKLKCKRCGATILVNAGGATTVATGAAIADHASAPAEAEAAHAEGMSYLVNVAEGDQRTMTIPELVGAYQSQVITADTYVWADGMGDWQALGQVEPIVSALSAGAPAQPAYAATPAPMASAPMAAAPFGASSAEAAASAASLAASASARPAARRETSKRADVFGNEKNDDIATSAPLFSASAKAAASNAAAAARGGGREENSVLFSLNALTSKPGGGGGAPSASPSRKDSREDSGLIDLKALAAAAAPSPAATASAAAMMGHDDAGLFPLGMPSAHQQAAPPVAANVSIPPPASKAPMFIGIGALVAALAIVGVFLAMKGGDEKPPMADTQAMTATPAATPAPTPEPTTAAPEPTATATATATASAVAAAPKNYGKPSGKPATATTGGGGKPATTATAPAAKPKGNCGCASGDLMCAMRCSAGGK